MTASTTRPPSLLFANEEARLAALNELPRGAWLGALVNSHGGLEPRLAGLLQWRDALLRGELPEAPDTLWPEPALAQALRSACARLELPAYCREQAELTETVLRSLVFHLDLIVDYRDRGASQPAARAMAIEAFSADWQARRGEIDELVEVLGELGELFKNTHWDQLRGVLRSAGWQEAVRIRRLLERLPELTRILRRLGRVVPSDEPDASRSASESATALAPTARQRLLDARIPELPGETRGIHRSGRFARMLPSEAVLLNHPRLRLVWHARHAERALLTYEDDDRMREVCQTLAPESAPQPMPARRLEAGPILICVDTSGSMRGGAEAVAKAAVLEAVRTARAQRRACHVFAFGGPGEILELPLMADGDGIQRLADFMGQSFQGGTDICGPLERALERLESNTWHQADLLLATDGEFGATAAIVERLEAAKRTRGLRVQGLLIGDRETIGLLELADAIHWVRDWRRFGTSDADSPVHSERLTALYFPGALRSPEHRQSTRSGADAAAMVRAGKRTGRDD
ncbi:MAG: VWA domain-containing protein [Thiotrichales bacterium]